MTLVYYYLERLRVVALKINNFWSAIFSKSLNCRRGNEGRKGVIKNLMSETNLALLNIIQMLKFKSNIFLSVITNKQPVKEKVQANLRQSVQHNPILQVKLAYLPFIVLTLMHSEKFLAQIQQINFKNTLNAYFGFRSNTRKQRASRYSMEVFFVLFLFHPVFLNNFQHLLAHNKSPVSSEKS